MSEARTFRLEEDVHEIKATLARLEPMIIHIDATLPHLATKAELTTGLSDLRTELTTGLAEGKTGLADLRTEVSTALARMPSHAYLWGVMAVMVGSQAVILAAAALALSILQAHPQPAPLQTPAPHASILGTGREPAIEPEKDADQRAFEHAQDIERARRALSTPAPASSSQGTSPATGAIWFGSSETRGEDVKAPAGFELDVVSSTRPPSSGARSSRAS